MIFVRLAGGTKGRNRARAVVLFFWVLAGALSSGALTTSSDSALAQAPPTIIVQYRLTTDSPFIDVGSAGSKWSWILRRGSTEQGCFEKLATRGTVIESKQRKVGIPDKKGGFVFADQPNGTKFDIRNGGLAITGTDINTDDKFCLETRVENLVIGEDDRDRTGVPVKDKGTIIFRHTEPNISIPNASKRREVAIQLDARRLSVKHSAALPVGSRFTVTSAERNVFGEPMINFVGVASKPAGRGVVGESYIVPSGNYLVGKTKINVNLTNLARVGTATLPGPATESRGTVRFNAWTTSAAATREVIDSGMRYQIYKAKNGSVSNDTTVERDLEGEAKEIASSEEAVPIMALAAGHYVVVAKMGFTEVKKRFQVKAREFTAVELEMNVGTLLLASKLSDACASFGGIYSIVYDANVGLNGERLFYGESDIGNLKLYLKGGSDFDLEYRLANEIEIGKPLEAAASSSRVHIVPGKPNKVAFEANLGCATFTLLSNNLNARKLPVMSWKVYRAKLSTQTFKIKFHSLDADPNKPDAPTNPGTQPLTERGSIFSEVKQIGSKPVASLGPRQAGILLKPRFAQATVSNKLPGGTAVETKIKEGYLAVAIDEVGRQYSKFFTVPEKKRVDVRLGRWHSQLEPLAPLPDIGF